MANKKKKKKIEEQEEYDDELIDQEELKYYDKDDYRLETKWEVFLRNYRNVPGFKSLVKLGLYFLFIVLIIVAYRVIAPEGGKKESKTETTTTEKVIKFQDLLDELLSNKDYKCEIKINEKEYVLSGSYGNNILVGSFYTTEGTYSFKLQDHKVYEIKINQKVENDSLLKEVNKNIIDNNTLVSIIKHASGIKVEDGYKYTKVVIDDLLYNIDISINDNHIKTINLTSDDISYKFTYDELFLID